jgi:hypothetical protein
MERPATQRMALTAGRFGQLVQPQHGLPTLAIVPSFGAPVATVDLVLPIPREPGAVEALPLGVGFPCVVGVGVERMRLDGVADVEALHSSPPSVRPSINHVPKIKLAPTTIPILLPLLKHLHSLHPIAYRTSLIIQHYNFLPYSHPYDIPNDLISAELEMTDALINSHRFECLHRYCSANLLTSRGLKAMSPLS